jgi:hypothetical protein
MQAEARLSAPESPVVQSPPPSTFPPRLRFAV